MTDETAVSDMYDRFVSPEPMSGCWVWIGARNQGGYGQVRYKSHTHLAHRVIYESFNGLIPDGLQLDHLCKTPSCVNPKHLEAVTGQINTRRGVGSKTHCAQGHILSGRRGANGGTSLNAVNQYRYCLVCNAKRSARHYNKRRQANGG